MSLSSASGHRSGINRHRLVRAAFALACGLALGACQFQPLYASRTDATGATTPLIAPELAAISIDEPADRVEQVLRNELDFLFTGGGSAAPTRYRLRILTDQDEEALAVEQEGDIPANVIVTLSATFILSEVEGDRTLVTGTSFQTASFSFSTQRFANVRALRDTEDRAARAVARDIAGRLAAYFKAREES